MTRLNEKFLEIASEIADPAKSHASHLPLLDILDEVNGNNSRAYNPEALNQAGIDPKAFLSSWALGFAKGTLSMYTNPDDIYGSVVAKRCRTCLSTEGNAAFGNVLPDDVKVRLQEKLTDQLALLSRHKGPSANIG